MTPAIKQRIARSLNQLIESFVELFIVNVGYVNDSKTNRTLIFLIDALESVIQQQWFMQQGLETLTTDFRYILTTIHMALAPIPIDIETKKTTFQNSFRLAAAGIIDSGMANVKEQQEQIKQNFMSDLFSGVLDNVNTELLYDQIEPIHVFGNIGTLNAVLYKIQREDRNARLPEEYLRPELFRRQVVNDNKIKQIYDIYCRVADRKGIPRDRFVQYLINKKTRNKQVHQASALICDHLTRNPPQMNQNALLNDFINDSIFAEPPAFTPTEIGDVQSVYSSFIEYSKLPWHEK
jgi:hypothetical protein